MSIFRSFRYAAVLFFLLRLGMPKLLAQTVPPPDLNAYVERTMRTFEVPGVSIAIVKDEKIVLAKGYGVRKLGEPTSVDENTLFPIASNTKAFTTAALATLVDEGKISWDDPVYQRLPGFQMYDPYVSHEMTIRDLLTHHSGMGLGEGDLLVWPPPTTFTEDEIIYRLRFMKPHSSFRSHYAYDNLLYITAGRLIPAVTGISWDDYVRERILKPLGMKTTTLSNLAFKPGDDYAWPHSKVGVKLQPIEFLNMANVGPAGSLNSSSAEMAKWILLQLNRGKLPDSNSRLFSEQQSLEMWSPQTIIPIKQRSGALHVLDPKFLAYGLGWGIRDYHGRKLVTHSGGTAGFVSRVMLVPEENLGIVVLTNAEQDDAYESIIFHILDYYFALPLTNWTVAFKAADDQEQKDAAEVLKNQNTSRAADSKPSLPLEKYAGVYTDPWYGPVTIRMENGHLVFTMDHTPAAIADMQHWQYDTFKAHFRNPIMADAFLTFSLKADGSMDHFTMVPVSPLTDFSFDYQDLYFTPRQTTAEGSS